MSWPSLSECVHSIDVSRYDNWADGEVDRTRGRINWAELKRQRPDILHVSVRAAGASSGVDPDFSYNYDEAEKQGYKVSAYVNANSARTVASLLAEWKAAIGSRQPKLISKDAETWGNTVSGNTAHIQDCGKAIADAWPAAAQDTYTAGWCWNSVITHGWEGGEKLWDAHYPYFIQDADGTWRMVHSFEELDRFLPIGNSFTPLLPTGFSLANCVRWQASDEAIIPPIAQPGNLLPRCDIGYMLRSFYESIWGISVPAPPSQPRPIVEVRYHASDAVDVRLVAS